MQNELEKRLEQAAPGPRQTPDMGALWRKGRRQRAFRQTTLALSAAVIVGVTAWVGLAARDDTDPKPIDETKPQSTFGLVVANDGRLEIHDTPTGKHKFVNLENEMSASNPSWVPADDEILYAGTPEKRTPPDLNLFTTSVSGGRSEQLTHADAQDDEGSLSADGNLLAFIRRFPRGTEISGTRGDLFVKNVATDVEIQITSDAAVESSPSWAPDGRLMFRGINNQTSALYVATNDGNDWEIEEIRGTQGAHKAEWSPDGVSIAFTRQTGRFSSDLFIVRPETGQTQRLTNGQAASQPRWTDDSNYILFSSQVDKRDFLQGANVLSVPAGGGSAAKVAGPFRRLDGFDFRGEIDPVPEEPSSYGEAIDVNTLYQPQAILPGGEDWFVSFTEPPHEVGAENQNWAWASTTRLRGNIRENPHPAKTLEVLPEHGVFVSATARSLSDLSPRERSKFGRASLPLDVREFPLAGSYEGQVRSQQPMASFHAKIEDYALHVQVIFGSEPNDDMFERAQEQVEYLYIRPPMRNVSYNGAPLPDPVAERTFREGSIELPSGWELVDTTTSPPSSFIAASYPFHPGVDGCEGDGIFGSMPSDGIAIVGYANPGLEVEARPEHVRLDPATYAPYEGWGCMSSYRIDLATPNGPMSLLVFFRDEQPSNQSIAVTLRAIDSLRFN